LQVGTFIIDDEDVVSVIYRILVVRHGYLPFRVLGSGFGVPC
jgi:hypothetical protein